MAKKKKAAALPLRAKSIGAAYAAYPFVKIDAPQGRRLDTRKLAKFEGC